MECKECRRLERAHHQVLKERVLLNGRMVQAVGESDLRRFDELSREMDQLGTQITAVEVAVAAHAASPGHMTPLRIPT